MAGCLPTLDPACACDGLPINLLLLFLKEVGVVSTDALNSGNDGANKLEYRLFLWLLISDPLVNRGAEVRSGVVISEVESGRSVAMETRLLG